MSENKLVSADRMVELARHAYNEWNLAMAAAEGNRQINKCFKMQDLCKAVESVVNAAPAVDAVEVVRCRDCRHFNPNGMYDGWGRCDHPSMDWDVECYDELINTKPDDFCSYGERNTEEK